MTKNLRITNTLLFSTLITALSLLGCDDDDDTSTGGNLDSSVPQNDSGSDAGNTLDAAAAQVSALYAVPSEVYGADLLTSTSYVPVVPSLDVATISIDDAREVDGRASIARVGKYIFIASANAPIANRFVINDKGELQPDGNINFMNEGLPSYFAIDSWGAHFVSDTKAYIFNGSDGSMVIWNPTTLTITGKVPAPPGLVRAGYELQSGKIVRGNKLYRLFSLVNYDAVDYLTTGQVLVVYDLETDKLVSMVEENRCPQLYGNPFLTESGDIYFSGWVWPAVLPRLRDYPRSCALRVPADQDTFDPNYKLEFATNFDGHEGAMMSYLGNGQALVDLFYHERATYDSNTDLYELANTTNWRVWKIDLATGQGAPLDGIDFTGAGYTLAQVDNRSFLLTPDDATYSATTAFEVVDGPLKQSFKMQGSSYQIVRAR